MEPITTALIAALAKLAEPTVKDAYEGLKALIVKKLGPKHAAVEAVTSLEQTPGSAGRRITLGEELGASSVASDAEIIAAARKLIETVQAHGGNGPVVHQKVTGNRNIFSATGDIHISGQPP